MSRLSHIIQNELFITCPLLRTDDFVKYCNDRDVFTSREHLERFEKLGIFFPFARVEYPKMKIKVEYINDRKQYRDLGILKDGEQWDGETVERYSDFPFNKKYCLDWQENGYLWEPQTRPFQEWKNFHDDKGYRKIESFYSKFQIYELFSLLGLMRIKIGAEYFLDNASGMEKLAESAKKRIDNCQQMAKESNPLAYICQILSNRYYPQTQTDQRTINISKSALTYHDWDWYAYCREWNAKAVLNDLGMDINEIEQLQKAVARKAEFIDPLEKWYELVAFISNEKKKKLKGDALFAQALYSMEHMLRLFYRDLTAKELPAPNESSYFDRKKFYGEGIIENELKYLEFIVNQYNLNPRPRLILVLEGKGEEEQFPRLVKELFGYSFSALGIEVINMHGVGNFEGKKVIDKYGAWEKFIDYYHSRQTIVFLVLDNEGRVLTIKQRLIKAISKFFLKRHVTKDEYICVWRKSIEFDNFSHLEIAQAMTELAENKYQFKEEEIRQSEQDFGKVTNPLGKLFLEKVKYEMNKPKFLDILFAFIISNGKKELDDKGNPRREVVRVLMKIIELAGRNYQPFTNDTWEKNQVSGWLGEVVKTT